MPKSNRILTAIHWDSSKLILDYTMLTIKTYHYNTEFNLPSMKKLSGQIHAGLDPVSEVHSIFSNKDLLSTRWGKGSNDRYKGLVLNRQG